jgi:hypothetical protein
MQPKVVHMIITDTRPVARTLLRSKPIPNTRQDRIMGAPDLMGMIAGFEHGAKYGVKAFKQIWYLRIDVMILNEQMGWRVARNIKSF